MEASANPDVISQSRQGRAVWDGGRDHGRGEGGGHRELGMVTEPKISFK